MIRCNNMFDTIFYQPVFNIFIFLYNLTPGKNLAITIVVFALLIKILLYSLTKKQLQSQKEMQEIQPKINELKLKHKDNKEELGRATLALYKEHQINPFSSCLPVLIQLPFLFAIFKVLREGLSGNGLNFIYSFIERPAAINTVVLPGLDLAQHPFVIGLNPLKFEIMSILGFLIVLLSALSQYWQMRMMFVKKNESNLQNNEAEDMAATMNKQMMYLLPVMMFVIGGTFPIGLSLYWLIITLLSILQQKMIFGKISIADDVNKKA